MATPPDDDLPGRLDAIDAAKTRLDAARPLPAEVAAAARQKLLLELVYHSNALSGSTLTQAETEAILRGNDGDRNR